VAVTLINDRKKTETSVTVTAQLAKLFGYAHHWALEEKRRDECTLTFSSMLAAMVAGPDPLCEWLRGHLALRGVSAPSVTKGRPFKGSPLPDTKFYTTDSFRDALAEATRLAGEQTLDVRHFMAAYVVVEGYHREDFLRLRIDRRAWCLELAQFLKVRFPEEAAHWAAYSQRAPPVLLPGFDADLPKGADLLGIGREVEAFAMLIAGKETLTPLSIGVFGAWGSGKSYFMARVEERVAALAMEGSRAHYLQRIAQVRFNAWHYSETNVVASLVDQIFRNLRIGPNDTQRILAERQQQAFAATVDAAQVLELRQSELRKAEEAEATYREAFHRITSELEPTIRGKREELSAATQKVTEAQQRLQQAVTEQGRAIEAARRAAPARGAAAFVMQKILEDLEVKKLADEVQNAVNEARWVGLNLGNILWGVGALVLTALAMFTLDLLRDSKFLMGVIGFVAATAPIALKWMKTLRELATKGREYQRAVQARTEAAVRELEDAGEKARAEHQQELENRRKKVEELLGEIASLTEKTQAAERALEESEERRRKASAELAAAAAVAAEKRKKLESTTTGLLLEEFVAELNTTEIYKKELGTLAQARGHFERLSERMHAAREAFEADPSKGRPVLERVVLYIDDLDRCPANKVRELLQAVHLLLAFDLFVCIVAVDPRWVIQCLQKSPGVVTNPGIQDSDLAVLGGVATPSDYLEKIFQIPLWLRPVPLAQRSALIGALLGKHLVREDQKEDVRTEPPAAPKEVRHAAEREEKPSQGPQAGQPDSPRHIEISQHELEFLPRVGQLLDGNTRALKRFANTYRLVKAALSDVELRYFAKEKPYRVCMVQLALLATQRRRARVLVRFTDGTVGDDSQKLPVWLGQLESSNDADARLLARDLREALLPEAKDLSFGHFAVWLEKTRRYSFYL
jgi:hypothetical protein